MFITSHIVSEEINFLKVVAYGINTEIFLNYQLSSEILPIRLIK